MDYDKLLQFSEKLQGLPVIPLAVVFLVCLGWALRAIPVYPNKFIPLAIFITGVIVVPTLTPKSEGAQHLAHWIRYGMIGLISAEFAWLVHPKLEKLPVLREFFPVEESNEVPKAVPTKELPKE